MLDHLTLILAQEDAPPTPSGGTDTGLDPTGVTGEPADPDGSPADTPKQGMPPIFMIIFAALVVMIVFSMSGQRKEKKKRAAMLTALSKGDRIQTIGGILGTTVEVRDDHVVVKIDESSNTRIKIARSAVQTVIQDKED
jgi:preprotein translocase subunit YajC